MRTTNWMWLLCAALAFSAMAEEIPVSPHSGQGAAPRDQYDAVVASNGDQYFVVWSDRRADVRQTYATRVSRDGMVLDPNGFRVASGGLHGSWSRLDVIWGGNSWFVFSNVCGSIRLVRVATDGTVLDSRPHNYSWGANCPDLSLASDGRHIVMGFVRGYEPQAEAHAVFLDSDAKPIAGVRLSSGETGSESPMITASGSSFVAVWKDRAVRFDRNGIIGINSRVSFLGSADGHLKIASDGTDMLVVRGNQAFRLSADLSAEPLGTLPFSYVRSIVWDGSAYVVTGVVPTFQNNRHHHGNVNIVRIDDDGRLLAQQEVRTQEVLTLQTTGPAVASNGQNVLVAWHDPTEALRTSSSPESDLFLSVASLPELTPGPRKLLSVTADPQLRPETAASGSHLLTVWQEVTGIYARRHWRDGRADGPPIHLTLDATSMDVVFNGSDFIVATTEGSSVVTRQLPAAGELRVLRESRFHGSDLGAIVLATSGGATLAAWLDDGVQAARLAADGSMIGFPLKIAPSSLAREAHRVAISPNDADEFLVVWGGSTRECFCSPFKPSKSGPLRAARVTSTLMLLDPPAVEIATPVAADDPRANPTDPRYDAAHSLKADHPSATWNGQEWLVVWNRGVREAAGQEVQVRQEIRGRRIARDGTLLDGAADDPGVLIARDGFAPTVAFTGYRYVLAWYAGVPTYHAARPEPGLHPMRTALFDSLGGTSSGERTLGESPAEAPISIAVVPNDFTVLAYSRLGDDKLYGGVSRAFLDVPPPDPRRRAVRR